MEQIKLAHIYVIQLNIGISTDFNVKIVEFYLDRNVLIALKNVS